MISNLIFIINIVTLNANDVDRIIPTKIQWKQPTGNQVNRTIE